MRKFLDAFFGPKSRTITTKRRLALEPLEDRLAPAGNILVSTDGAAPQQLLQEYTSAGALVRSLAIPPGGVAENARDLVADSSGNILVYNGTYDPYLSTYAGGSWSHQTYAGWSTVNNVSYGGIGLYGNYAFVTDMNTSGDAPKGIIRFNRSDGTASRFATTLDFIDLTIGADKVYALTASRKIYVYNPTTLALQQTITLPSKINNVTQDYRGIAVNASGQIFAATWGKMVHRFNGSGVVQASVSLASTGTGELIDIDTSGAGQLVVGSRAGHVIQMTEAFTGITTFSVGNKPVFVAFAAPVLAIGDVAVTEGNSGTVNATFIVSLSGPSSQMVSVDFATADGTAASGSDFTATSGTVTFAPGETSKTITVAVQGDTLDESDETFVVNLTGAVNAAVADSQGVGTIVDDDTASISINDVAVGEGDGLAAFTISLSTSSSQTVTVDYATANGTALAGSDYGAGSGSVTFAPGETSQTVSVSIVGDAVAEPEETFLVNLTNAVNASIDDDQGVGTITDDDVVQISIGDTAVTEGDSGTTLALFTVTLSTPSSQTVTVDFASADGTAVAGTDYDAATGTVTFAAGETSKTIAVVVRGDTVDETTESFAVNLSGAVNGIVADAQGTGTINDDDTALLSINDVTVTEGDGGTVSATFTVSLSLPSAQTVTVSVQTEDGTASAGSDYVFAEALLTLAPGTQYADFTVTILGDAEVEADETFLVYLFNNAGAGLDDGLGMGTIADDDVPNQPPLANAGPDQWADEGSVVYFDGTASSDPEGDPLTYEWDFGDGDTGSGATANHIYADNGSYTVTLTVSDGNGGSASDTLTVSVANVAPTAYLSPPSGAVRGQTVSFNFSSSDPGSADHAGQATFVVDWGDGYFDVFQGPATGGTISHVFTEAASYQVTVIATDKDGATSAPASVNIAVGIAQVMGGDLYVGGSTGGDQITVIKLQDGQLGVLVNNEYLGSFFVGMVGPDSGAIIVFAQAGDDLVELIGVDNGSGTFVFPNPAVLFGDDGNDFIDARPATGLVFQHGGAGNDVLLGGSGRNMLIGGLDVDTIYGGSGQDLLIGGTTAFDGDFLSIVYLTMEWSRPDADFQTRVGHLTGTLSGGYNGDRFLNPLTVLDDAACDEIFAGGEADWVLLFSDNLDNFNDPDAFDLVDVW